MSRVPRELSEEELLKLLEEAEVDSGVKTIEYKNDVLSFLSFYNIKNGTDRVSRRLLFKIYRDWSDNPVKQVIFSDTANLFLDHDNNYFNLNQDTINLSVSAFKHLQSKKRDKTKSRNYQKHFQAYLDRFDLKEGKIMIPTFVLYYLYDKWTYENKNKNPLSQESFSRFLPLYFKERRKIKGLDYWYAVGRGIYKHITKERVSVMVRTRKSYVNRKEKQASAKED